MPPARTASSPCSFLVQAVQRAPQAAAILSDGRVITYATLGRRAQRLGTLIHSVVPRGERVALLMDNSPDYVSLYWGILFAGASSVELNPTLSAPELHRQMVGADACLLIASKAYAEQLALLGPASIAGNLAVLGQVGGYAATQIAEGLAAALDDTPADGDFDALAETPVDAQPDAQANAFIDAPIDSPVNTPADALADTPAQAQTDIPTRPVADTPAHDLANPSANAPADARADTKVYAPVDALADALADALSDTGTTPSAKALPLPDPQSLASIVFTSGTTGQVKGVELTHANLAWTTEAIAHSFGLRQSDAAEVFSGLLPLYYTYGKSALHLAAWCANPIVFSSGFASPRTMQTLFKQTKITLAALVPYQCHALLQRETFCTEELPSLSRITVAGGGLDADARAALEQRFPGRLTIMYGLTEASTRVSCLSNAGQHPNTSCGPPLEGVDIRIEPLQDDPPEKIPTGQIMVRGPNVMRGYFRDPAATGQVLKDGWLCTGDLGYLDEAGALHVTGRLKEIIKVMGESISASTVETSIKALPEVADAAVIGVPHAQMGEAIHAYVCLHTPGSLSPDQIRGHCAKALGRVRTPSQVIIIESLPRTASGKVRKHLLGGL